ncbi:ester cyclase [Halomarina rubra]|uniref:Ester cyclase n=1 Tax=Halomarina rubra TaxID=2071873 RepID=A0ABD6B118_9EURY|nr:ester cyclase [Halomarina rubra]
MATTATPEDLYRRISEEIWENHNYDAVGDLVAPDYEFHDSTLPEPIRGPEGYREMAEMGADIVDGHVETDLLLAVDDYAVARWTQTGRHVGRMGAIEPTDEEVTITGIDINRFEDGKLAETWSEVNFLPMLMQVGELSPELFEPPAPTDA